MTDDPDDTVTLEGRPADDGDGEACPGCGRVVTLLSNGFCGFCQDDADDQGGDGDD